jgi:hypothetical protein
MGCRCAPRLHHAACHHHAASAHSLVVIIARTHPSTRDHRRVSAAKPCHVQREQTTWLEQFAAAIETDDNNTSFCQQLITMRKATMEAVAAEAGMRVRTTADAEAEVQAKASQQNRTTLEGSDGKLVDPSTLLRQLRANKYFTFRKHTRLLRWKEGGEAGSGSAISLADDQATVQSAEVWLVLDGPNAVIPVVVVGAFTRISGALRTEVSRDKPVLLKNVEALQLHLFGEQVSTTASGTTYRATGKDFIREPRRLLHKLDGTVNVASIRTERTLRLSPAAMNKLTALASDPKMAALWKVVSPGKKKAVAAGTAGSSGSTLITDAMRKVVAAAAARAVAASAAALGM